MNPAPAHSQPEGEAIFDICLAIAAIRNSSASWTPPFHLQIGFLLPNYPDVPSPYQLIQDRPEASTSLSRYESPQLNLPPHSSKKLNHVCLFRIHVPIYTFDSEKLSCEVEAFIEEQSIGTMQIHFNKFLGLQSYIPAYLLGLGVSIEAVAEVQLLGFRFNPRQTYPRTTLYKMIDCVVLEHNLLSHKQKALEGANKQEQSHLFSSNLTHLNIPEGFSEINEISGIARSPEEKNDGDGTRLEDQTQLQDISEYPELTSIRKKSEKRIFSGSSLEEQRSELLGFCSRFFPQTLTKLNLVWTSYLKIRNSPREIEALVATHREKFFEELTYEVGQKFIQQSIGEASSGRNWFSSGLNCNEEDEIEEIEQEYSMSKALIADSAIINLEGLEVKSKVLQKGQKHETAPDCKQIVVLVHGYGANSVAMLAFQRVISYICPSASVLNSKSNEIPEQTKTIEDMGRALAAEIELYLQKHVNERTQYQISFICHSLGGLVARAALIHLDRCKFNMNLFISLACPHLGHLYHSNRLAKFGMVALTSLWPSRVINCLLLKDGYGQSLKNSFIYNLSTHPGLSWFKSVSLYGSEDDGYVSVGSALMEGKPGMKGLKEEVTLQMVRNLAENFKEVKNVIKFGVKFSQPAVGKFKLSQALLGRESHLNFVNQEKFVKCVVLSHRRALQSPEREAWGP